MKRLFTIFLVVCVIFLITVPVFASDTNDKVLDRGFLLDEDGFRSDLPRLEKKDLPEPEVRKNPSLQALESEDSITPMDLEPDPATGSNNLNFNSVDHGSILLTHDGDTNYGYYRHAGIFNEDRYSSLSSRCIATAVPGLSDTDSTTYQTPNKFHNYDECVALYVRNASSSKCDDAVDFAHELVQDDIPYKITGCYKDNYSKMYCSKLSYPLWSDKDTI